MNKQVIRDELFNKDSLALLESFSSFSIESFYLNDDYYCTRIVFSKQHVRNEYQVETIVGDLRVVKAVKSKWDYIKYTNNNELDISLLIDLFDDTLSPNLELDLLDPAAHDNWPLWDLARDMKTSAKLYFCYEKRYKDEYSNKTRSKAIQITDSASIDKVSDIEAIESEVGLSINRYPFMHNCTFLIFPYESASIVTWRLYEQEKGWEGLKVKLYFSRFLKPFPKHVLHCKLYNDEDKVIHDEELNISNDDELVFKVIPEKENGHEIHRVEAFLYQNNRLIDDRSGYPIRKISVDVKVTE